MNKNNKKKRGKILRVFTLEELKNPAIKNTVTEALVNCDKGKNALFQNLNHENMSGI